MTNVRLVCAGLIAATALAGCGVTVQLGFDECSYQGATHPIGETFASGDGCNTCTCQDDGTVACTEMACAPSCEYQGNVHASGETFAAGDGCNTCSCGMDGMVSCTEIACNCMNPVDCEQPAMGCHYEGGDCNSCGTLVCDCMGDPTLIDCGPPPMGCTLGEPTCVMGQWQCGAPQCNCAGCDLVDCEMGYQCVYDQTMCGICVPNGQIGCAFSGAYYLPGEMFAAGDGCNYCTCDMTGMIQCTNNMCTCEPCSAMLCGPSICTEDMMGCGQCGAPCPSCSDLMCMGCTEDMLGCGSCPM